MKRVILLMLSCIAFFQAQAQVEYKDIPKLTFFGVDFSEAKVYGAKETPYEFRYAFEGINLLFQTEAKKYDIYKFFKKNQMTLDLATTLERIQQMDLETLMAPDRDQLLTTQQVEEYIKGFDTGKAEGYGAIMIANLVDKSSNHATYDIVVFDIQTREIIKSKRVRTKGRGIGLRNFWAHSVLDALKMAAK